VDKHVKSLLFGLWMVVDEFHPIHSNQVYPQIVTVFFGEAITG
jgi:hypothetical protein